jgi:hypothetical protein
VRPDRYEVLAAVIAAQCALQGRLVSWLLWLAILAVWTPPAAAQ